MSWAASSSSLSLTAASFVAPSAPLIATLASTFGLRTPPSSAPPTFAPAALVRGEHATLIIRTGEGLGVRSQGLSVERCGIQG